MPLDGERYRVMGRGLVHDKPWPRVPLFD